MYFTVSIWQNISATTKSAYYNTVWLRKFGEAESHLNWWLITIVCKRKPTRAISAGKHFENDQSEISIKIRLNDILFMIRCLCRRKANSIMQPYVLYRYSVNLDRRSKTYTRTGYRYSVVFLKADNCTAASAGRCARRDNMLSSQTCITILIYIVLILFFPSVMYRCDHDINGICEEKSKNVKKKKRIIVSQPSAGQCPHAPECIVYIIRTRCIKFQVRVCI